MKLSRILKSVKINNIYRTGEGTEKKGGFRQNSDHDPDISSLHYRAQDVQPGGLFVAIPGILADGHDFIDQARIRGAFAVISQKPVQPDHSVTQNTREIKTKKIKNDSTVIEVNNSRKTLAKISAAFFRNPSKKLNIIGITGTNGKTTTAYLIESMLSASGLKTGVIGTINYRYMGKVFENPVTTPESLDLQKILAKMLKDGVTHVVLEVSSHAIDLFRIENCFIDTGVFTNLTQDHLDYHGNMNSYWLCKKRLFTEYLPLGPKKDRAFAVINSDNPKGQELFNMLPVRGISTGHSADNMIRPNMIKHDLNGIAGSISTPVGSFNFKSSLVGKHNIENILSATGVGIAYDLSLDNIKAGIENVFFIPGRLERITQNNGRFVYVDYAHTPDALGNVLTSLKAVSDKKIICVFGCGGDRDRAKRPLMGEMAGRLSDLAIVTSDNPRTEDPAKIIEHILSGLKKTCNHEYSLSSLKTGFDKKGYAIEPNRRRAIKLGIAVSRQGDTVLIAGKGHETYQILGNKTVSFDDRKEAKQALLTEAQSAKQHNKGNPKSKNDNRIQWKTADILKSTGGKLIYGDLNDKFSGISIDSRSISPGDVYVAIKGEIHDGHSFAEDVIRQGISGLVIDEAKAKDLPLTKWKEKEIVCITVNNTTKAFGDLASFHRKRSNASVVAITGSNGKTTTREMTAAVVRQCFATLSSRGNFNNEIGLPLTLLKLNHGHKWAVVEVGMNAPGEIARLGEICRPDIGVITNIGPAHLEGVGSIEGVMCEKGKLLDKIKAGGTAVLNSDDRRILHLAGKTSADIIFYGISDEATIRAKTIIEKDLSISFTLVLPNEEISIDLKIPGIFMVSNALAAAAVGYKLGLSAKEIKTGLEDFKPVGQRMNILHTDSGVNLIDDTYNANPGSMEAALKTLTALKKNNRGIFVAGDMFELGKHAKKMHEKIGVMAARSDISLLYATGEFSETVARSAESDGMKAENIHTGNKKEIINDLTKRLRANDWVLVKGSRGMGMEEVVKDLMSC
ncbi:MAG: UDP-N-acetylmuramoyl-L-alanyl-D-glutamate--2,6-diaminopimelate ligase [Deltaproteobacteria bacterium]|nr:UDP-N-acetylmuramoyl-L-alanyl-D-glutamate--2,6-diaminopimelate ligase [Deltaproteobacteria bacterium]